MNGFGIKPPRQHIMNIFFGFIEKAAIYDLRVCGSKKEKRTCTDTKKNPDGVYPDINCIERPVFPIEQPYKKRPVKDTLYNIH
jgi:hypothetical protein